MLALLAFFAVDAFAASLSGTYTCINKDTGLKSATVKVVDAGDSGVSDLFITQYGADGNSVLFKESTSAKRVEDGSNIFFYEPINGFEATSFRLGFFAQEIALQKGAIFHAPCTAN